MRFLLTAEQEAFGRSLDALLSAADVPTVTRAWAAGDPAPGHALFARLADAGLFALAVPEAYGGLGPLPVELVVAFVELGRHAVPGPLVESVAVLTLLTRLAAAGDTSAAERLLPALLAGRPATLALPGEGSYVLDPGAVGALLVVEPGATGTTGTTGTTGPRAPTGAGAAVTGAAGARAAGVGAAGARAVGAGARSAVLRLAPGHGLPRVSADPARRLARPAPGGEVIATGDQLGPAAASAAGIARLLTAAQALGVGLTLLDRTVAYVGQRRQFGTPVGAFQAVKHRLADTMIGLEFARPLVYGAALTLEAADIAAAKVTAGEAGYAAARAALQLHGAVGYTEELDLSLWLRKARPLRDAWGTPGRCRARVLAGVPAPERVVLGG